MPSHGGTRGAEPIRRHSFILVQNFDLIDEIAAIPTPPPGLQRSLFLVCRDDRSEESRRKFVRLAQEMMNAHVVPLFDEVKRRVEC